jgi:hypothetical protein
MLTPRESRACARGGVRHGVGDVVSSGVSDAVRRSAHHRVQRPDRSAPDAACRATRTRHGIEPRVAGRGLCGAALSAAVAEQGI